MVIRSKYYGKCTVCSGKINKGDQIEWTKGQGAAHVVCAHDSTDPIEEHGRAGFADPGGRSALRAGYRMFPCPTCGREDMLTSADKRRGYQCDICADGEKGIFDREC